MTRSLKERLDDALSTDPLPGRLDSGAPLLVTKGRLTRVLTCDRHAASLPATPPLPNRALACGAVVDALFRQLVTVGAIGDPMADGLAALRAEGRHDELLAWIAELPGPEAAELTAEVVAQSDGLRRRWPRLDPSWMPRTQEPLRVRVARGAVELAARVDLAVGVPGEPVASVALVEVKSGLPRPEHDADLRFAALVEALRHPAPPFAVANYYTQSGELRVATITETELNDSVDRTIVGIRRLRVERTGGDLEPVPAGFCAPCRLLSSSSRRLPGVEGRGRGQRSGGPR